MKIILLRHGQSQWNLENRFTGWKDVTLTDIGFEEATFSGNELSKMSLDIKSINTSLLKRAIETTKIVADIIKFSRKEIKYNWRLNERHYGALQGLNKSETALKYGEDQVHIWRRSYDISPPSLGYNDKRHLRFNSKFKNLDFNLINGESLKNVIDRLKPFFENYKAYLKKNPGNHLIVAHSNSLRAIVKLLDKLSKEEVTSINIPTGVPLVYTLDSNFGVINKEYIISEKELKLKQELVKNQGKAK